MRRKSSFEIKIAGMVFTLTIGLSQAAAQATGSISGKVVDEAAAPVAGARVLYHNLVPLRRDARGTPRAVGPYISSSVLSGSAGEFQITALPAGDYVLCATGTAPAHVWSCLWDGATPGLVRLTAGQSVTNKVLVIRTGTLVKMKVQDPAGRIAAGAKFIAGVLSSSGHYGRSRITTQTAIEVEYTVVVPKGTSGRIFIDSPLTITTVTGQPVEVRKPSLPFSVGDQAEVTIILVVV